MEYKILDKGFIRLVEHMGGDLAVVQGARVSYGGGSKGEEQDKKLIAFLLRNHHETPFEQAIFKFHVKCPIFVARQWFRHRWGSFNEISGRYTEFDYEFYVPDTFRVQTGKNYQYEPFDEASNQSLREELLEFYTRQYAYYEKLLKSGVAKELARIVLPLGLYTQFYWTVNARSLLNFIYLRAEEHAQAEIRAYAEAIQEILKANMPWTYEAFEHHVLKKEVVLA